MTFTVRSNRWRAAVTAGIVCGVATAFGVRGRAQTRPDLSGTWTLNRDVSEFPRDVGFDPNWARGSSGSTSPGGTARSSGGGGRAARGGGGGASGGSLRLPPPAAHFQSEEDSKKIQELVNAVNTPPARLTITQTEAAVTFMDPRGGAHTFHAGGKEETLELDAGPIGVTATWEHAQLVIRYRIDKDRELRYRYSREPDTRRLMVAVQFADHGRGDVIKRFYDVAKQN